MQYSKEDYEHLMPKIVEHMRKTGEWGEHFNPGLSYMGYNETVAQEQIPLTKEQATEGGWIWHDDLPKKDALLRSRNCSPADHYTGAR